MSRAEPSPWRQRRRQLVLAAAAAAVLGACAPMTVREDAVAARRAALASFTLEGRLSATDGRQAASGRVEWEHADTADRLVLVSPLGQIVARLDSSPIGASLTQADGSRLEAASADTLLPAVLGVDVPAARLPLWVQGATDAATQVRARDDAGRPLHVIDQGWRIDYLAYADERAESLPARLDISRGDARIRLIIDAWTTQP